VPAEAVLVDDVVTTGATLVSSAAALRAAGAVVRGGWHTPGRRGGEVAIRRYDPPGERDPEGERMRIEVKGRNTEVTDELRARVERRFAKVGRQVSPLARMEIELSEERNPSVRDSHVAEGTLFLKGVTLRARERSDNMVHSVNLIAEELARQVKRHRDKRRRRRAPEVARPGGELSPGR
jgi:putative sigma-54 modulation protein